jgi:hypothetical protein
MNFLSVSTTDYSAITQALTNTFNIAEIGSLIGTILSASVGGALLWWGARKLVNAVISAFKTGKIKF